MHFHDAKRSILRTGRAPSALCAERRSKAQYVTRTRVRESMSTPVSKTKALNISWVLLFYDYSERTIRKRNGEMSDAAIVPVERGAAERLAFTCCVKERPRARRRLRRRAAQTKKSADRDASTPVSKTKALNISWVLLFYNSVMNTHCRVMPRCKEHGC